MRTPDEIREMSSGPRLVHLVDQELIPPNLAKLIPTKGGIDVAVNRTDNKLDFVVVDESAVTLNRAENNFTYLDEDKLKEFPSLAMANGYRRPLAQGTLSELSPELLFVGVFETNPEFRGKGVGVAFQENLFALAKKLGYRLVAGYQNDPETAKFFLKRGRYLLEEVKDEYLPRFQALIEQEPDQTVFYTIKFLEEADVREMIKPDRINTSVDDKIEYKEKSLLLFEVFKKITNLLLRSAYGKQKPGDLATVAEVIDDLNSLLPETERLSDTELPEDDQETILMLQTRFQNLKSKKSNLLATITTDQLKENLVAL